MRIVHSVLGSAKSRPTRFAGLRLPAASGSSLRAAGLVLASLCALPLMLAACGDDDHGDDSESEPFDSLQDCFDDHHSGAESLPTANAITVCCLDHPIKGVHPSCGDAKADCIAHVDTELDDSISQNDIDAACTAYINEK
jgi:hypothetical protein